jgi:ATP-binding cassette subfamily B protein
MRALRRLAPYHRLYWLPFWAGLGLLLVARVFEALIPQLLKQGIDRVAASDPRLALPALGIAGCVLARYVTIAAGRRWVRRVGMAVAYDLRNRLYAHLQHQDMDFFRRNRTGDLMARAINDLGMVRRLVAQASRTFFVMLFSASIALVFMLRESWSLTLLLLPPLPLIAGIAWRLARRVHDESTRVQEGFSTLSERVQENLSGVRTIQALCQEPAEIARFASANDAYVERNLELVRTTALLAAWMPALGALCTLAILGFGGSRVVSGEISLGSFTAFLWYLGMLLWPVRDAGNLIIQVQSGFAGVERVHELLDAEPAIRDRASDAGPERLHGELELCDLTIRYPGAPRPALDAISCKIAAGETVAILGPVGSGKSTLLRALVRLVEPPPGSVHVDGIELGALPLARLRAEIALAPQEPFLFSDTVRENLSYDDVERPLPLVQAAADAAELSDALENFPHGFETLVGERGVMLSGGQKQRVTLARAFVRDAPVLLLDDPFSAVDSETEARILGQLCEMRKGRTTLIVSHRPAAARAADRVLVLQDGRLVESGSHAELLARGGVYAALERVQTRRAALLEELAVAEAGAAGARA